MRNLQTKDLFSAVRTIKKIGVREEFKKVLTKGNSNENEVGLDLIFSLLEKASENNSEQSIYEFLSGPLEMKQEEIAVMDPVDLLESIEKIANIEKWKDFFKKVSQFMK